MIPINQDDVRDLVSPNAFRLATDLRASGAVRNLRVVADTVTATVKGGAWQPYDVTIIVERSEADGPLIHGDCSCPVGFDCKHVAAVLLQLIARPPAVSQPEPRPGHGPVAAPLPPDIAAWLASLAAAGVEDPEAYPPTLRKRLLYLLETNVHGSGRPRSRC